MAQGPPDGCVIAVVVVAVAAAAGVSAAADCATDLFSKFREVGVRTR